jgi:formylglycine-generating enzyme required for sulfatase activity
VRQRWFLSYNTQDLGLTHRFEAALRRRDADTRIFLAPVSLRAGSYWLPELAKEIAEATAFVLLVGEHGLGLWQTMEYYEALDRRVRQPDFAVLLVLVDGQPAPGLPFLRQLHWIVTADPASEASIAKVMDAASGGGTAPGDPWRHTAPYRGLAAMTEADSDYFFGRGRETVETIAVLAGAADKVPTLIGNSGVGKSSLAQAGVLAALMRQAWPDTAADAGPWPAAFCNSRRWCFLSLRPGTEPVRSLVDAFLQTWQLDPTGTVWPTRRAEWVEVLMGGKLSLRDLIDQTGHRYAELQHPLPPDFLIYIDQGEELADSRQRRRFSELLATAAADLRLHILMSLRADFFGELQNDEQLYRVHRLVSVSPLREAELREVVSRPAALLAARFETETLAADIARRAAEESARDAGTLPLLSYLLDDMWRGMVERGDGVLRLPARSIDLGGVLVGRADAFMSSHPDSEERLRRIFTLKLATVREDGEPTRRRGWRGEFSDEEWRLVGELSDHPNRLLVTGSTEAGETYAEVAHEAIFRRWDKLRDWIAGEREFLAWRTGLEAGRRAWQATPEQSKQDALLMGAALAQAQSWLAKRAEDLPATDRDFISKSMEREKRARARARRVQALLYGLLVAIIIGLVGVLNEEYLKEQWRWFTAIRPYMLGQVRPYVLTAEAERTLKPGDSFKECAKDCPEMVVIPAGEFTMGSPASEQGRYNNEDPQHRVVFAKPFAVAKFDVTFDDWDACLALGDCDPRVSDSRYGRGRQPVINVSWGDARRYAAWLSRMTGKPYRLLSEAEFEYAARAGTLTVYPWGDDIATNNANCVGCGSRWDGTQPSPVGSFAANRFGLHDMHGNVWQWVEDCHHSHYDGAPQDGSAWIEGGDCGRHVARGGAWDEDPRDLRSAIRHGVTADRRGNTLGFRVGRTLAP